jgi:uncharacterized membrane protein
MRNRLLDAQQRLGAWYQTRTAALHDDTGALSTEGAIIAAALAIGAGTVTAIIIQRASTAANNIPTSSQP